MMSIISFLSLTFLRWLEKFSITVKVIFTIFSNNLTWQKDVTSASKHSVCSYKYKKKIYYMLGNH